MKTERNEQLIARRKNCGFTQEEVAKAVGISYRFYQKLEAGESNPNVVTAISIAELLKCNVSDLFGTSRRQPGDDTQQPDYSNSGLGGVAEMKELDRALRDFDHRDIGVVVDVLRDGRLDDPGSRGAALKARDALNRVLDGTA
ncbi:MAG: helix-turn-helix domain-containing protein [Synergistaceae bacterium]|jgi:DNA-binding XRE family transcriptional regulator|nr:helix-turn-helix domain-containing protein [Synergistaceae bacterium]